MKALFILSGNLSTTPRALKIIENLKDDIEIEIIAINRSKTWAKHDKLYKKKHNLNLKLISISKKNLVPWLIASFLNKISLLIYPFFKENTMINAFASEKASIFLKIALNYYSKNYDFVASFSYGSIYPATSYAHKHQFPIIIDIEDFHVGEKVALTNKYEENRRKFILQKSIEKANYLTYASPLIGLHTINLLSKKTVPPHKLINNSFSQSEFVFKQSSGDKIKFVWFSQTVDYGRGLELIIPALAKYKNQIELHIIGNMNIKFKETIITPYQDFITIYNTLNQIELNKKLADFDIGLAIEQGSIDINKDLALSNKIFAYAQAGLYILASNTQAQNLFIKEHENLGEIVRFEVNDMDFRILSIIKKINEIRTLKANRFQYSKKLSWEEEFLKIKIIIENIGQTK